MRWPISWRIRTSRCDIRDTHHKSKATCRAGQPLAGAPGVCATRGIVIGPKEMQRDIWLIANHPAVVRYWRNVKKLARSQLKYASTLEGHRRCAGQHQANMFNITPGCANAWPDVATSNQARMWRDQWSYRRDILAQKRPFCRTRTSSGDSNRLRITAICPLLIRASMRGEVKLSPRPRQAQAASGRIILQGSASLPGKGIEQAKQHKEN